MDSTADLPNQHRLHSWAESFTLGALSASHRHFSLSLQVGATLNVIRAGELVKQGKADDFMAIGNCALQISCQRDWVARNVDDAVEALQQLHSLTIQPSTRGVYQNGPHVKLVPY